MRVNRKIWGW